jgi:hypothetical protein
VQRAKLLDVMGNPPLAPASAADADAFCSKVLEEDFPEDECVTPNNPRTATRLQRGLLSMRQDGPGAAQLAAALATGSSQQQQQRYGGGGSFDALVQTGPPPSQFKPEGEADLSSPCCP